MSEPPLWGSLRGPDEPPAPTLEEWLARISPWPIPWIEIPEDEHEIP